MQNVDLTVRTVEEFKPSFYDLLCLLSQSFGRQKTAYKQNENISAWYNGWKLQLQ